MDADLQRLRRELVASEVRSGKRHLAARRAWNKLLRLAAGGEGRGRVLIHRLKEDPSRLPPELQTHLGGVAEYIASGQFGDVFRTKGRAAVKIVDMRHPMRINPVFSVGDRGALFPADDSTAQLQPGDRVAFECTGGNAPEARLSRESIVKSNRTSFAKEVTFAVGMGVRDIGPRVLYPSAPGQRVFFGPHNEIGVYVMEGYDSDLFTYLHALDFKQTFDLMADLERELYTLVWRMVFEMGLVAFDLKSPNVLVRRAEDGGMHVRLSDVAPNEDHYVQLTDEYSETSKKALVVVLLMLLSNDLSRFTRRAGSDVRVFQAHIATLTAEEGVTAQIQRLLFAPGYAERFGDRLERILHAWGVDDIASAQELSARHQDRGSYLRYMLEQYKVTSTASPPPSLPEMRPLSPSKLMPPPPPPLQKKRGRE